MERDRYPEPRSKLVEMLTERDRELRFHRAIATCARTLLAADSAEHLDEAMRAILEAADVTSVFVERNVDDDDLGPCTRMIHEVSPPGVEVDRDRWALVPWSQLPDTHAALAAGRPSLGGLDELGEVEAAMYAGSDVKAEANYPIFVGDRWVGLVGFSDRRSERDWTDDDVRLMAAVADVFSHLWERQDRERQLEEAIGGMEKRYAYEHALARCSQVLLSGADEHALQLALETLLELTSANYGTIERNVVHPELGLCSQTLCRAAIPPGGGPVSHDFDEYWFLVPWSRMPDSYARLAKGTPFVFRVAELGPEERALYEGSPTPTASEVDIPVMVDGEWRGLIAFGYHHEDHRWDEEDLALFQTAADMVGAFWQRQDARDRLEELIRSKDEFLAAVSHELRTPLTLVVGLAEELRDRAADFSSGQKHEFNTLIAHEGMEMAHLVEDLLVAARSDAGGIEVEAVPIDVGTEIARVVSGIRAKQAISIASGECRAIGDAMRVRQVLRNLLTNAVRHGGPSVRAACLTEAGLVVVAISDDGPEIEPDAHERIFEPFQRGHVEISQPASVGLGLTVSRNLARLMGGDLIYRRLAERNVFQLILPAAPEES